MKILMVIPALGSIYGGPSKVAIELAQAIGAKGVSVDIVATNANGLSPLDVPLQVWQTALYYRVQYFPYLDQSGEYKFSWPLTKWLYEHAGDYDLVHINAIFCYPPLPAYWVCRWRQIPYIVAPHGMLEPWAMAYKQFKKRLYYQLFEKPSLDHASALHMLATPEAQHTNALHLKSPQVVISNGIHRQDFELLPEPELFFQSFPSLRNKRLVLFLGRVDPKKGLDLLALAFARVHQLLPETHLVIAGPDNIGFLPTAKHYFSAANCLDAVTFTGMLVGELKLAALAASEVYIAPSYSEGFSMSVLEGMASGLPCVITTGCNFPEAGTAQAAYVVSTNATEIAEALLTCLENPQSAKAMGLRAREFIFENYTWEKVAAKLIKVYEAILGHAPIPIFTLSEAQEI